MIRASRFFCFVALLLLPLLLWWRPLLQTLDLALHNGEYTHILLVLPTSAALIFLEWRSIQPIFSAGYVLGSLLLVLGAADGGFSLWGWAGLADDNRLALSMTALVAWWIGSFILCFGMRAARMLAFPLGFLVLLIPLPSVVLNTIVAWLQDGSASTTALLFEAAGIPVSRQGILLAIPGLSIEVAKECSSIRSSLMLLITTLVLSHLFLRSTWRKGWLVLIALPLSVIKNGLRIFTISVLGTRVNPAFLHGQLHHSGGIVFFIVALAMVLLLLWLLQRGEKQREYLHATAAR
jgi:exosortase